MARYTINFGDTTHLDTAITPTSYGYSQVAFDNMAGSTTRDANGDIVPTHNNTQIAQLGQNSVQDTIVVDMRDHLLKSVADGGPYAYNGNYINLSLNLWVGSQNATRADTVFDDKASDKVEVLLPDGWSLQHSARYSASSSTEFTSGYWQLTGPKGNTTHLNNIWLGAAKDDVTVLTGDTSPPCFAKGSRIQMASGEMRKVEDIKVGDMVRTLDHGAQMVVWMGNSKLSHSFLSQYPNYRPVRVKPNALKPGHRGFTVSPQHKIYTRDIMAMNDEKLVAAKHLVNGETVKFISPKDGVTYYHMMFDQHQIVNCEGVWSESFYPGGFIMSRMPSQNRKKILSIISAGENGQKDYGPLARAEMKRREVQIVLSQKQLVEG